MFQVRTVTIVRHPTRKSQAIVAQHYRSHKSQPRSTSNSNPLLFLSHHHHSSHAMPQPSGYSDFVSRARVQRPGGTAYDSFMSSLASNRTGARPNTFTQPAYPRPIIRAVRPSPTIERLTESYYAPSRRNPPPTQRQDAGRRNRPAPPPSPQPTFSGPDTQGDLDFFMHFTNQRAEAAPAPPVQLLPHGPEIETLRGLVGELLRAAPS
jgi:hypothetical protein